MHTKYALDYIRSRGFSSADAMGTVGVDSRGGERQCPKLTNNSKAFLHQQERGDNRRMGKGS